MVKKVPPLVCFGFQISALVFLLAFGALRGHNLPFDSTASQSLRVPTTSPIDRASRIYFQPANDRIISCDKELRILA